MYVFEVTVFKIGYHLKLIKILQVLKFFVYSSCISGTLLNDLNCGSEFSGLSTLSRRLD